MISATLLLPFLCVQFAGVDVVGVQPAVHTAGALDVAWGTSGVALGRWAMFEVRGEEPLLDVAGVFLQSRVIAAPLSTDGRTWVVLAPVSVEAAPGAARLVVEAEDAAGQRLVWTGTVPVLDPGYDERHLTVSRRFVRLSPAHARRAEREAKTLAAVLARTTPRPFWRGAFIRPTAGLETSPFGTLRTYNDEKKSRHLGLDFDGAVGAAIVAANAGRVVLVAQRFFSGGTVVIDHGQGVFTLYFHMSRIDVREGQDVTKGDLLGGIGATGQVTGPHLHFGFKADGESLDPHHVLALDLPAMPEREAHEVHPHVVGAACTLIGGAGAPDTHVSNDF